MLIPPLRAELRLLPGPPRDGSPTWTLHDPLLGTHHAVDWLQGELLRLLREPSDLQTLTRQLASQVPGGVSAAEVGQFVNALAQDGLLQMPSGAPPSKARPRRSVLSLLFLRLPMWKPARGLLSWQAVARRILSPPLLLLGVLLGVLAAGVLVQHGAELLQDALRLLTPRGIAAHFAALILLRAGHETAHALVAAAHGVPVRGFGLALLLGVPVPYVDITDAWQLPDRRARLRIDIAGVLAELLLVATAVVLWAGLPVGDLRSVCAATLLTGGLATMLVNLNPALRYDGYYLLADLLGIDNLQMRSRAALANLLQRMLYRNAPPAPPRRTALLAYACAAWAYRLAIYVGILTLLVDRLPPPVGLLLALAAGTDLVLRPLWQSLRTLLRAGTGGRMRPTGLLILLVLLALVGWVFLPLPRTALAPAWAEPVRHQTVYAPHAGVLRMLDVAAGDRVNQGDCLAVIESLELQTELKIALLEQKRLAHLLAVARDREPDRLPHLREQQQGVAARVRSLQQQAQNGTVRAGVDGVVVDRPPERQAGQSVAAGEPLLRLCSSSPTRVTAIVPAHLIQDLRASREVLLQIGDDLTPHAVTVTEIDPAPLPRLPQPWLSAAHGGPIPVVPASPDTPVDPVYRFTVSGFETTRPGVTGTVRFRTRPRSPGLEFLKRLSWRLVGIGNAD